MSKVLAVIPCVMDPSEKLAVSVAGESNRIELTVESESGYANYVSLDIEKAKMLRNELELFIMENDSTAAYGSAAQ